MSNAKPPMPTGMRESRATINRRATSGWRTNATYFSKKRFTGLVDHFTRECETSRHVQPHPRRHPLRFRPRSRRAQRVGSRHVLSGLPRAAAAPVFAHALALEAALARAPFLAHRALLHRRRDPSRREH